ncbi:MAG: hypothetical protein ACE5PT_05435 [Gemmatimonadales bacterium]
MAGATRRYTEGSWEEESFAIYGMGAPPPRCPQCRQRGFYGPRFAEPDLKYRACKFCGFWQYVEGEPRTYLPSVHGCEYWPLVAGAPYIWWVAPDQKTYTCPWCDKRVRVASSRVKSPADDPEHSWRKLRQSMPQRFYMKFWAQWPTTVGRIYL